MAIKAPPAPNIYTAQQAKLWQTGWVAGWQTSVPAYLPEPSIAYTAQEASVWLTGRDRGFWDRFFNHLRQCH